MYLWLCGTRQAVLYLWQGGNRQYYTYGKVAPGSVVLMTRWHKAVLYLWQGGIHLDSTWIPPDGNRQYCGTKQYYNGTRQCCTYFMLAPGSILVMARWYQAVLYLWQGGTRQYCTYGKVSPGCIIFMARWHQTVLYLWQGGTRQC